MGGNGDGMKKRNPVAKKLSDSRFKPQVVKSKKGKGSYSRKKLGKEFDKQREILLFGKSKPFKKRC